MMPSHIIFLSLVIFKNRDVNQLTDGTRVVHVTRSSENLVQEGRFKGEDEGDYRRIQ
jgi:hypothetical protein